MSSDLTIRTQRLGKTYPSSKGDIVAVEGIDLTVQGGRIFGLLGPNGAGKTTTIRMLCGLIRPTSGAAWVDGLPVAEQSAEVRKRIGLVPEDAGDYKNLTLLEELEYHGAFHGLDSRTIRQRAMPLIERLNLGDRLGHPLKTFSRGMRRKFHLIRALLHQPRILLLDEPTAGLDPQSTEEMWHLFQALAREHHVTVILCSHHLEEVERLCDDVAILRRRLLMQGSLDELRNQNRRYRVRLAGDADSILPAIRAIEGVQQAASHDGVLHLNLSGQADLVVPQVVRRLVECGAAVLEVARQDRDLRSLYRDAIDRTDATAKGGRP